MALTVVTGSTGEPLSVLDAKDHLRVGSTAEDILIESYIGAARQWVETYTRRALLNQTFRLTKDDWPRGKVIEIPRSPLSGTSNVEVTYVTSTGLPAKTFDSTNYIVDDQSEPPRVVLKDGLSWPGDVLQNANGVRVQFRAGYGASTDVPEALKQSMKLLVGHWYQNRESVVVGTVRSSLPMAAESLASGYRVPTVP